MGEVVQIEPALTIDCMHQSPDLICESRFSISRKTHHLVLVAIFWKTQKLSKGGVENTQRMRERHRSAHFYFVAFTYPPHNATEIAKAVNRYNSSLLKRRCKKCTGKMRSMMFHKINRVL